MPAINMGAASGSNANVATSPVSVMMSPFSGPTGSPFDAVQMDPTTQLPVAAPTNYSTGALSTGIGFGCPHVVGLTAPQSVKDAGFTDDYTPGVTNPDGTAATLAVLTCIGGGKSLATENGEAVTDPYEVQPLLNFGNGGSRDAGAGPAFTGFATKMVTATGSTANGAAIEAGFVNRSGLTMATGQSAFGSSTTASAAVA